MRSGIEFLHKPMYTFDVWFGDFKNNEHYKMGALGWRQNNRGSGSPRSSVKGLKFGFSDVSCTKNIYPKLQMYFSGRWLSSVSSTNKSDRYYIIEILLKVTLSTTSKHHEQPV